MLLIGVFALILLWVTPAGAGPLILPAIGITATILGSTTLFAVVSAAITMAVSTGLSFAAAALFKPSKSSAGAGPAPTTALDAKQTVKQGTAPHQVIYGLARAPGVHADMWVRGGNQYLYSPIIFAGHECEEIVEVWLGDQICALDIYGNVTNTIYAGNASINLHTGSPDQAVDFMLNADAPERWTVNHRLRGRCYIAIRLLWDNTTGMGNPGDGTFQVSHLGAKLWNSGIPNITAIIKGKKVYDPRSGLTTWSDNSALIVADYLCDQTYGLGVDYDTGIDEDALIAAADACDELVSLAGGGTEKRYCTDGYFSCDASPDEVLGQLLSAMHGRAVYDGERWRIFAGVYQEPELTITDDDMRAGSTLQTLTSSRDTFNGVKGIYLGPGLLPTDFPAVKSAAFTEADGGEDKWQDIQLPYTRSAARAQRIAKITLLRARQEIVETFKGKLSCWRVAVGDTILRTSERYGWTEKPFEVTKVQIVPDQDADGNPVLGVDITLQETHSSIFDWETDEESTVDPAPNTELPDIFNVLPPSNLTAVESLYFTRTGGGVKARVELSCDPSPDAFVRVGGGYQFEYRLNGTSAWTRRAVVPAPKIDLDDFDPGIYDFRAASVNWAGNLSPYITITVPISGLSARPAAPTGLTVNASGGLAIARWDYPSELDVQQGGGIEFRHSPLLVGATWKDGTTISDTLPANSGMAILPLKSGTYLAKFVDSTENYSADAATFVQNQSSVLDFTTVGSVIEDPAFAGAKSGVAVLDGALQLDDSGDFDSVPDVDAMVNFDYSQGVAATGTYDFASTIDLGSVQRCRLTGTIDAQVLDVFDDFDSRSGEMDDWPDFDGAVSGNEGDARLQVRWTLDDPGGSPTWTAWEWLHSAEYEARAFQFRLGLSSTDPAYSPAVSGLNVLAEAV